MQNITLTVPVILSSSTLTCRFLSVSDMKFYTYKTTTTPWLYYVFPHAQHLHQFHDQVAEVVILLLERADSKENPTLYIQSIPILVTPCYSNSIIIIIKIHGIVVSSTSLYYNITIMMVTILYKL